MKLTDLDAKFYTSEDGIVSSPVADIAAAKGVDFLCPKCFEANGGRVGTHHVRCWFTGAPPHWTPNPGRWNPSGTGLGDLTFVGPGNTSVLINGGCHAHFMVEQGETRLV